MTTTRLGRALGTLATLVAVAVGVVAVPAALVLFAGLPIPRPFTASNVFALRGLADLAAICAWAGWLIAVVDLARDVAGALRGEGGGPGSSKAVERVAIRVAGGLLALGSLIGVGSAGAVAVAAAATPNPAAVAVATPPAAAKPSAGRTGATALPGAVMVTVEPGDSLWSIAQRVYGDGGYWQLLAQKNLGHIVAPGMRFLTPGVLYPGWQLAAPLMPDAPQLASPAPLPTTPPTPVPAETAPAAPAAATPIPAENSHPTPIPTPAPGPTRGGSGGMGVLPELAAIGLGGLAATIIAKSLHRRRRSARTERELGQVEVPVSEAALALAEDLAPFAGRPAPGILEAALAHLTAVARAEDLEVPGIRLVRVGPAGVALVLGSPAPRAPGAFVAEADGMAWVLPADVELSELSMGTGELWLPALVPIGEDDEGAYLMPIEPGEAVGLEGSGAAGALAAMRMAAECLEWYDCQLWVYDDPVVAASQAGLVDVDPTAERLRILYVGEWAALDVVSRGRVGLLGTVPRTQAKAVLRCEDGVTTVEPFGLVLGHGGFAPGVAEPANELLAAADRPPVDPPADPEPVTVSPPGALRFPPPSRIEARVLTPVPRIDGIDTSTVPTKRLARVVEIFCYLALAGEPVPRHELITEAMAVGGDTTAAVQTLRNTVSALRRVVGPEVMPRAYQQRYSVDDVSSDLARLEEAVLLAKRCGDEDDRVELLYPALELIEGRPASRTTLGWAWWIPRYDARARDAASDAAELLAPILAARGDRRGARWALDQARLIEDGSEALHRVAMECGGMTGDAGWIEREMQAWCAKVEELTPGASPSEAAYETYRSAMARFAAV